jgi:hypothetical protein
MKNRLLFISLIWFVSCAHQGVKKSYSQIGRIENDLQNITQTKASRNYQNVDMLNQVSGYIYKELIKCCDTVYFQEFKINGNMYRNVIGSLNYKKKERIVIGAHYDVAGDQEGADDNASGVCGVLELARLLENDSLDCRIDLVAYTLEEPPFYGTDKMGSYIHARSLHQKRIDLKGMICLEMIGYFDTTRKSQTYPIGLLKPFYGGKGDFITIVQKFGNGKFGRKMKRLMKRNAFLDTKSFIGPEKLPGIDFSDHRNYWKFGYSAVMITNTAFYRNPHYHKQSDKMETLDLKRMSKVIDGVYLSVKEFR